MTKLLKDGKVTADAWVHLADDADVPENGPVTVSLERWLSERDALAGRADGLGIRLEAGETPEQIKDDLGQFQLVALVFPKFADGRAYSYARMLKGRLGFGGEVRAIGEVLRDQFRAMHRCGFDALEVSGEYSDEKLEAAWQAALGEMRHAYQPAYRGPQPIGRQRHPAAA